MINRCGIHLRCAAGTWRVCAWPEDEDAQNPDSVLVPAVEATVPR